jgi:hypothetical protein
MPGGHSSLVVARAVYATTREFFDREEDFVGQTTRLTTPMAAAAAE